LISEKFQAIDAYRQETVLPVKMMCSIMAVSRSGYYKWLKRQPSAREMEDNWLKKLVEKLFHEHQDVWGYRRITMALNHLLQPRQPLGRKKVRRLMHELGLHSIIRRQRRSTTRAGYFNFEENLLNRDFSALGPNQKWVTDITYLTYDNGQKAYLSAIKDLYDGTIISYKVGRKNDLSLVIDTLRTAHQIQPLAKPLLHSDRGSQYTSKAYLRYTTELGYTRSMSRVGKCIDNAPMESFWGHFKEEWYDLQDYASFGELKRSIDEFIYFYNHERYQERLNGLSPLEFRTQAA
jgi:transposase InsO family protein